MKRKSNLPTAEDITTPIAITCANCGAASVLYPAPDSPTGCMACPNCSPKWLGSFAVFSTEELREERGLAREFQVKGVRP